MIDLSAWMIDHGICGHSLVIFSYSVKKLVPSFGNVAGDQVYNDSSTLSKNPLRYGKHSGQEADVVRHAVSGCP